MGYEWYVNYTPIKLFLRALSLNVAYRKIFLKSEFEFITPTFFLVAGAYIYVNSHIALEFLIWLSLPVK